MTKILEFYLNSPKPFTVLTAVERQFTLLPGVRCIAEDGTQELLRLLLALRTGETLAVRWGVDENQVSRLRKALGVPLGSGKWPIESDAADPPVHIQALGATRKRLLLATVEAMPAVLVAGSNIILEVAATIAVRSWLIRTTVRAAATSLLVDEKAIVALRSYLAVHGRVVDSGSWRPRRKSGVQVRKVSNPTKNPSCSVW